MSRAGKDLYQPNLSTLGHNYIIIVFGLLRFLSSCKVPWYINNSLVVLYQLSTGVLLSAVDFYTLMNPSAVVKTMQACN